MPRRVLRCRCFAHVAMWAAVTASSSPAQDFTASLVADDGQGIAYELVLGFSPHASDAYDPSYDTYAPPPPPVPSFDAALGWGSPMDRYYTQVLLGDGDLASHQFELQIQYDTNQLVQLTWDSSEWADRMIACTLRDPFGAGILDVDMLASSDVALTNTSLTLLHLTVTPSPWSPGISSYCPGASCPCGNHSNDGAGCTNGTGAGALIWGSGSVSSTSGDLVLHASGLMPDQPGLYFQGNNAVNGGAGVLFGDGLRCAGGGVKRLQVAFADMIGTSQTTVDISSTGQVVAGDQKRYQLWYRDPNLGPCGSGFNLSNGLAVAWEA